MSDERKQELASKVQFVKNIEKAIVSDDILTGMSNVESVKYEVYYHKAKGWEEERLVVTFKGGAISVRNCNHTSCSGILKAIAELINGGYYDEVPYYEKLKTSSDYVLLDLLDFE